MVLIYLISMSLQFLINLPRSRCFHEWILYNQPPRCLSTQVQHKFNATENEMRITHNKVSVTLSLIVIFSRLNILLSLALITYLLEPRGSVHKGRLWNCITREYSLPTLVLNSHLFIQLDQFVHTRLWLPTTTTMSQADKSPMERSINPLQLTVMQLS